MKPFGSDWGTFFNQFVFHPSGGLIYHSRAIRYAEKYWKNHLLHVEAFLNHWNPPAESILLVGPSAGYSLPIHWVQKFKTVKAIEPDPFARRIFEARFKIVPEWVTTVIDFELHSVDAESVLFCNVLGQIDLGNEALFAAKLEKFCDGKRWASYHDVLSGRKFRWQGTATSSFEKQTLDELKLGIQSKNLPKGSESKLEINAHSAYDLFLKSERIHFDYWEWRLTPTQTQVIEAAFKVL